jgi:hypothetical protein
LEALIHEFNKDVITAVDHEFLKAMICVMRGGWNSRSFRGGTLAFQKARAVHRAV